MMAGSTMIVALVLREWRDAGTFIINACNKGSASPHHMLDPIAIAG